MSSMQRLWHANAEAASARGDRHACVEVRASVWFWLRMRERGRCKRAWFRRHATLRNSRRADGEPARLTGQTASPTSACRPPEHLGRGCSHSALREQGAAILDAALATPQAPPPLLCDPEALRFLGDCDAALGVWGAGGLGERANASGAAWLSKAGPSTSGADEYDAAEHLLRVAWPSERRRARPRQASRRTCEKNKRNRSKVKYHQKTGSRSYVAHLHEYKHKSNNAEPSTEQNEELDVVEAFKTCHTSKKHGLSEEAREAVVNSRSSRREVKRMRKS